jgi:hypothetical protein
MSMTWLYRYPAGNPEAEAKVRRIAAKTPRPEGHTVEFVPIELAPENLGIEAFGIDFIEHDDADSWIPYEDR